jgi:hypothetical protein
VHPVDRVVTIYRFEGARFGLGQVIAASGQTPVAVLPGLMIDWGAVFSEPP